jgi:hypothetical protein
MLRSFLPVVGAVHRGPAGGRAAALQGAGLPGLPPRAQVGLDLVSAIAAKQTACSPAICEMQALFKIASLSYLIKW